MKKTLSRALLSIAALAVGAALVGCGGVAYQDPHATETVNVDWGRTDLQMVANKMIESLVASVGPMSGERPRLYFHGVQNRTDEHIDTQNVTDKIKVALVKSQRFTVLGSMEVADEIRQQIQYQTGSGMVRPDTAVRYGQQIGARYFVYGAVTSIRKRTRRVEDVYFKFTLQMIDIETGVLVWADEKEISKADRRAWFGM